MVVHQAVRRIRRCDAAERDEGDALRLLWFAVAVAGRAGVPCAAGSPLVGLPEWIDTECYAIAGTIPDGVPVSAPPVLMTNLLKDRFRMASHTETGEMPDSTLVLARSDKRLGPSLKETSAECRAAMEARLAALQREPPPSAPMRPARVRGRASTRDDDAIVIDWQTRTENLKEGAPFRPFDSLRSLRAFLPAGGLP